MLPANELTQLRADLEGLLPEICDLLTVTRTADGFGGFVDVWTITGSSICRMDHQLGREMPTANAEQNYQRNMLTLPYDSAITAATRVRYNGVYYNVRAVSEGSVIGVRRAVVERIGSTPAAEESWYGLSFWYARNSVYAGLI